MANYTVLEGESIYDIAAKLYNGDSFLGISDLLSNNSIALDAVLPATLIYTSGISREISKKTTSVPIVLGNKIYKSWQGQSHFDIAIQLYGGIAGLANVISLLPPLNDEIAAGTSVVYVEASDKNARFFLNRIVATWFPAVDEEEGILMEDGTSFILQEDGTKILVE